jgi:hypothetical protein
LHGRLASRILWVETKAFLFERLLVSGKMAAIVAQMVDDDIENFCGQSGQ